MNTRDLRFLISSSVEEEDFGAVGFAGLDDFVDLADFAGLADLDLGGVESIRTDMSESLPSSFSVFRFFVGGEVSFSSFSLTFFGEVCFGDLVGDLTFTGDDFGVF